MITYFYNSITKEETYKLPKKFTLGTKTICNINENNMAEYGWEKRTREANKEPEIEQVVIYSKYKLKKELENLGLWEDVKNALVQANKWDDFLIANELATDNEDFISIKSMLADSFDIDAEDLLNNCIAD